jgi:PAS domain S-box-containing protein
MPRPTTTRQMAVPTPPRSPQVPIPHDESGTRHEYYELVLHSIGEGVHGLDAEGQITFVNQSAATMLGWTPQDLLGKQQHALIHHSRANGTPYPDSECPILAAVREGRVVRRDGEVFWRKDGSSFPVDYIATPIRQDGVTIGAVVAFRDVTDRQRAARQLSLEQARRSEGERLMQELQRVLMQVPAAVCTTRGPDHIIESANLLYQQLVGQRNLIGRTKREVFPESSDDFTEVLDRVYTSGEPYAGNEVRRVWDRGSGALEEGFVNFVYQPLRDPSGTVYGVMCHFVDVTELVRSRGLAEAHAEELDRVTQSLSRINRELDQFAYVASHDLKAPLRGIASLASWIEDDLGPKLGDESRQHLALLRSRVTRMETLIDGLLQYSRAGRVRNRIETVDVAELLHEAIEMLTPPRQAVIEIAAGMPTLDTERVPLLQVFQNLLGNAIKHSGRPDVTIRVSVRDDGDCYEFSVSDNGVGIPPQFHSKVWEMFQTLQPRDKVEGAGLGLALVKKNVENRGGRTWLESDGRDGATFYFLWPKRIEQDSQE